MEQPFLGNGQNISKIQLNLIITILSSIILNLFQYQKQSVPLSSLHLFLNEEYIGCHGNNVTAKVHKSRPNKKKVHAKYHFRVFSLIVSSI